MVKSLQCIFLFLVLAEIGLSQEEDGLSSMEAVWANREAIQNYDVSYRHWVGVSEKENLDANLLDWTEYTVLGRMIVDRKQDRVLYVREFTVYSAKGTRTKLDYFHWNSGLETSLSDQDPNLSIRKCNFKEFYKSRAVPVVELTMSSFPSLLVHDSLRESHEASTRTFRNSKLIRHADGSSTVYPNHEKQVAFRGRYDFDPVSSMPTKCVVNEHNPVSGEFIKNVASGSPKYEKAKEIYRISSIVYNKPSTYDGQDADVTGTCEFTWHQFNEDVVAFPVNEFETVSEVKSFLRAGVDQER